MSRFSMLANWSDYPDTSKLCISIFLPGCGYNCDGCHNEELQDPYYNGGEMLYFKNVRDLYDQISNYCKRNKTNNVSIMGGDPLHSMENRFTTKHLSNLLIETGFNVMIYTGCDNLDLIKDINPGFTYLKTGVFDKTQYQQPRITDKSLTLSSTNQKIYNNKYELLSNNGVFEFCDN